MTRRPTAVEQQRGFNRVLLVFAPEKSHPAYVAAREALRARWDELRQWEVRAFEVFGSGSVYLDGERLEQTEAASFRRDFGAHREHFIAVLLDMDGHELLRQRDELRLDELIGALKLSRLPERAPPQRTPAPHSRR